MSYDATTRHVLLRRGLRLEYITRRFGRWAR
jgi:hypothetical protein